LNYGTGREAMQPLHTLRGCGSAPGTQPTVSPANIDGQVVPQDGDLHCGIRTRPGLSPERSLMASGLPVAWRITCNCRPIEIGVTNRICTGTNAVTGRDAAVTS